MHFRPSQSGTSQSWVPKKGTIAEPHDHGVFSQSEHCGVRIWMWVLRMCGQYRLPRRWENELLWVISCKGNSLCSITKRIAWGASIYHLWRQRNARVHENQYNTVDSIFYLICNDVRLRIASFQNVADSPANRDLCERWCLPHTIFRTTRGD